MILLLLVILPIVLGSLLWFADNWFSSSGRPRRGVLGGLAALAMTFELALAIGVVPSNAGSAFSWGGGISLSLQVVPMVKIALVLVPLIALPVLLWAAAMEESKGLSRLLGLLIAFTGSMELLILAADLLVVAIAWELLGFFSWALIAHQWQEENKVAAANYSFNATRIGGIGLWLAAGAALEGGGSFDFSVLSAVGGSSWGHMLAGGILVAAAAKSAQGPFAPWLSRAMEGPSSVSALLHSSTMVAAGAWLLIRLQEPLAMVSWFGSAAIALGLATALAGGITAIVQVDAKRLLAASTSAQYGLMFAAVGAGYSAAGLVHLVAHAFFKALLFLAAGSAISAAGTHSLIEMRSMGLGRRLPLIAAAGWVGTFALAAIPPLGAAWSKEKLVAAVGQISPWLALVAIAAGALSAWYAMRLQAMAFDYQKNGEYAAEPLAGQFALWFLATGCLVLGLLWTAGDNTTLVELLPGKLPHGRNWELVLSVAAAIIVAGVAWYIYRRPTVAGSETSTPKSDSLVAKWWGLPGFIEILVIKPVDRLACCCAAFDKKVVDAGVRGASALTSMLSRCLGGSYHPELKDMGPNPTQGSQVLKQRSGGIEQAVDETLLVLTRGNMWLAEIFRKSIETAVDRAVDCFGTGAGAAGAKGRKSQTGSLPLYFAFLIGGFFIFFLTLILGI